MPPDVSGLYGQHCRYWDAVFACYDGKGGEPAPWWHYVHESNDWPMWENSTTVSPNPDGAVTVTHITAAWWCPWRRREHLLGVYPDGESAWWKVLP